MTRASDALTEEQRRAVLLKAASVALGAGAGCGKTTVLTERFLEEIDDPGTRGGGRALQALIALTFTEKAARELRQRIRARCRERLRSGGDPERWRTVLRALEAAPIGTFHEFCASLLRENALALGIDPGFAVLNETVASSLRDQAVRTALRCLLAARDPDLLTLGVEYGLGQVREALGSLLASRAAGDLEAWGRMAPEELAARWNQLWQEKGRPDVLRALVPFARDCRKLLEGIPEEYARLQERRSELLERLPSLESGEVTGQRLAEVRSLARIDDLRAKGVWPSELIKDAVKQGFEALRKGIDRAVQKLAVSETVTLQSAEDSLRLARVAVFAALEYDRIKAQRRGLDFDDLLLRTLELLGRDDDGQTASATRIRETVEFILVDEFQDTDRIQSGILRLLGGDGFSGGRMFVVGDAKQSIYRFRGADPSIFDRWRTEFPEDGRLALTENFRSVPGIVHFVNALFGECFAPSPSDAGPAERLAPVRGDGYTTPAVTFLWALPPSSEDDGPAESGRLSADARRGHEARVLACWLRQRLDRGWRVLDRETREPRAAHAGDVALLFRAMTDVWPYETALADAGFDYHTVGGSAFFAQQEVRDAVNVLSVVEDPLDEVALAGALRSPFFSLSDDGLFWLSWKFPGGVSEGLPRAAEIAELSDRDRAAATRAAGLLARWRSLKDRIPLASLVTAILEESGFEPAVVCESLGSRKLANARKLVRLARDFDRQESFTLGDLVARLRADLENPPREEQASTTDENSPTVRLMSIHQAKGLEFPIVVVPDLNRKPNPPDPLVGLHPDLGLLLRPPRAPAGDDPNRQAGPQETPGGSAGWMTFQAIEAEEERRESLRLFYVAATRARDHLILSAGIDEPDDGGAPPSDSGADSGRFHRTDPPRADSPAFQLLLDRFDWRTGACLASLPPDWPAPQVDVLFERPAEPERPRARQGLRMSLHEIERIITGAAAHGRLAEDDLPECRPRRVDLVPDLRLACPADRFDRLVQLVMADPGLLRGDSIAAACARAGTRLAPAASRRLVGDASRWLQSWPDTALYAELAGALRGRRPIARNVDWIVPWTRENGSPCTVRGSFDLLYRDRIGRWRPVIIGTQAARSSADVLLLALAVAAAIRLGKIPLGPAWRVHADAAGALLVEAQVELSTPSIEAALERWLEGQRSPKAPG